MDKSVLSWSADFVSWMSELEAPGQPVYFSGPGDSARRTSFTADRGEVAYVLEALPDGWVRLSKSVRGSSPEFVYDFATQEQAEAYLCVVYADLVRDKLGYIDKSPEDRLDPKERVGQESGRLEMRFVPWQGPEAFDGPRRMRVFSAQGIDCFRGAYPLEDVPRTPGRIDRAVALSWYIDQPLQGVLESLRDPSGGPFFELLGDRRA